jgi:uncharacterized protein YjdB
MARDADEGLMTGVPLTWTSADPSVATVDSAGVVTARGPGATLVSVQAESTVARVGITVSPPVAAATPQVSAPAPAPAPRPVAEIRVSPTSGRLSVGQSMRLSASTVDARGRELSGRRVDWAPGDSRVATVSASGVVTALAEGTTTITARSEGRSTAISLSVIPVPVATISVEPSQRTLEVGQTVQLRATPRDAGGIALDRPISWRSTDPSVASVGDNGEVRALTAGTATIVATGGGRSGETRIVVTAAVEALPVTDPETGVREALESYRVALESEDLGRVRQAYPGITAQQEDSWRGFFGAARDVRVAFRVLDLTVRDGSATARVRATLDYRTNQDASDVSDFLGTFERRGEAWTLVRVQ